MSYLFRPPSFAPFIQIMQPRPQGVKLALDIAFDAASNSGYEAALSTYSWSHTTYGTNRLLLVGVSIFATGVVSSATYAGSNLSFLRADSIGVYRTEIWYMVAPALGTNTVQVNLSVSLTSIAEAVSYQGVEQAAPLEPGVGNTGTGNPATAAVTPVDDRDWVFSVISTSDTAIAVHAGQNQRVNNTGALGSGAASDSGIITPPAATTMQWDSIGTLDTWAMTAVAINAAAAVEVTGAETAAGVDAATVIAALTGAETAAGVDAATLAAAIAAAETASGLDAATLAAALTAAETASGVDAASLVAALAAVEAASGLDVGTVAAAISAAEVASGLDTASVIATLTGTETATAVDAAAQAVAVAVAETVSGSDAATLLAALTATDSASGVDAGTALAAISAAEQATGVDSASILLAFAAIETAIVADAASVLETFMALSTTPLASPIGQALLTETAAGAVPDTNVRAGATSVYMVDVDNTGNGAATYVKLYDNGAPTVGTTEPDIILRVPASKRAVFLLDSVGAPFTNLSFAAVTTPGRAGVTSPTNAVPVRILCT